MTCPPVSILGPAAVSVARFGAKRAVRANQQWAALGPFVTQMLKEEARSFGEDLDGELARVGVTADYQQRLVGGVDAAASVVAVVLAKSAAVGQRVLDASCSSCATPTPTPTPTATPTSTSTPE